jgi:hypothetical protein
MENDQDRPPFFRSWNGIYLVVLSTLAILVALFSILTKVYE